MTRDDAQLLPAEYPSDGVFQSAVDAVIVMAHDGFVLDWNPAAERMFGYSQREAVGRELADLVITEALRPVHRAALRRYRETRRPTILNRRVELEGRRRDGTCFPLELTVTEMAGPDPPVFVGFIRDRSPAQPAP